MVEATGLEPTTSCSLSKRATKLRHASTGQQTSAGKARKNCLLISADYSNILPNASQAETCKKITKIKVFRRLFYVGNEGVSLHLKVDAVIFLL